MNRPPLNTDNDNDHNDTLVAWQCKVEKGYDTLSTNISISIGSTVVVQENTGDCGPLTQFLTKETTTTMTNHTECV